MPPHKYAGSRSFSFLGDELTSIPDTFTDIEDDFEMQIPTSNTVTDNYDAPLEFLYTGTSELYAVPCNSYVHVIGQIKKRNGDDIDADDAVGPVNLLAQALFGQADVYLNEQPVSKNNGQYAQRAYISTVVGTSSEAKQSWLESELYYEDTPGDSFDTYTVMPTINIGFINRHAYSSESKKIDMVFRPHVDMFMQSRPIPPNVDLKLRFARNSAEYFLMGDGTADFIFKILSASLYMRVVRLNTTVMLSHKESLLHNGKMVYPIRRVQMVTFTLPLQVLNHVRPNVVQGQLPNRIIMCMTTNKAFSGDYKHSPFRYRPFGLKKVCLNVNGKSHPSRPYVLNFDSASKQGLEYARCFKALTTVQGPNYVQGGNGIKRAMFEDGFTMFAFPITEEYSNETMSLVREGTIQLEMEFSKPLTEAVNVILHVEYENVVTIGKHGDVSLDY